MNEPIIIAGIIALISAAMATTIAGVFAFSTARTGSKAANSSYQVTNGLLGALTAQTAASVAQTKAIVDLTSLLRRENTENRMAHRTMCEGMRVLLDRVKHGS
jgi:hypothetical protein